jgi:transposase
MAHRRSDEFKRDAPRIALSSGFVRRQVSAGLGVGRSTLNKWVKAFSEQASPAKPDRNPAQDIERPRRESRMLKEERWVQKMRHSSSPLEICEVSVH